MVRELQNEIKGVTIFVQNSCKLMDEGKGVWGAISCMGEDVDIASSNNHSMFQAMINCIFTSHPKPYIYMGNQQQESTSMHQTSMLTRACRTTHWEVRRHHNKLDPATQIHFPSGQPCPA